jgi:alpha-glucosidase
MNKSKPNHLSYFLFGLSFAAGLSSVALAAPVSVTSPDGKVKAEVLDTGGKLRYQISVDNQVVLLPSTLGLRSDGVEIGQDAILGKPRFGKVNERYPFLGGKKTAFSRARLATIPVTSPNETYEVDLHVENDGVGVRLRLSAKTGRKVEADRSNWRLGGDPTVWAAEQDSGYESTYRTTSLSGLQNKAYNLPITAKVGGIYTTLAQANLKDFGDIAVRRDTDGALGAFLYADSQGWTTDTDVIQPWRVTMVARNLNDLVNNTLVSNLNPPPDPSVAKADWIRPGRSTWQWLAIGGPRFEDQHQWVDWTKQLGYEYYLVDDGWSGWPNSWESLKSVCSYAKERGVGIWVWVHSNEVKEPEARKAYFKKLVDIGAVGVKIDFPPACDRWWSNWYYDTARDAAASKLMVDYHGAVGATGLERTWPNVLTREAVRGHEWHITRYRRRLEPQHDSILPFTRYLVGPGDYTPTVFETKELQGLTWAHELAQAIAFTSPYLCFGGHPKDYVDNPAKDVLMAIPAVWDETRVLPGSEPGKMAIMARRSGNNWFVAALGGADAMTINIPLNFLGGGQWKATHLGDVPGKADAWNRQDNLVTKKARIPMQISAGGGYVLWLRK